MTTVLIIEDDLTLQFALRESLNLLIPQVQVKTIADVEESLPWIEANPPDLIIINNSTAVLVPEKAVLQLIHLIHQHQISLLCFSDFDDPIHHLTPNCSIQISKPFDLPALEQALIKLNLV